ncbi:hypothetical protein D9619_006854 [Psilocybe cf. subviscida]|uniref:pyranose dehydrogenase (acceptor) n=1 Tax=Psilocybe cf. subviscida TaxID=2480587 RepID=A0A8H5B3Z9_9AGAR|nr:hypothetical protein D9619_006854 [Psilocybe cf. subviscida]
MSRRSVQATLLALLTTAVVSSSAPGGSLYGREFITNNGLQTSYDYIIVGGGLAGLVTASRLTEDSDVSVLVLEAGLSGDAAASRINSPAGAYYASIVNSEYDWQHVTAPQTHMNNRAVGWPRGKTLGGSTAMNAMYLVRPAKEEMDAWEALINPDDKNAKGYGTWNWETMFSYMKRAENFTAPRPDISSVIDIKYDASTHGSGGPMEISYPAVFINTVANWTRALAAAGIPEQASPNGGVTMGGFIAPSSINPANLTRSYARSAYIDNLAPRPNLHILAENSALRIVFAETKDGAGDMIAKAVEFAKSADVGRVTVGARKEVLLAGGPVGSPKVLMHSGVGPKDMLDAAGVQVKLDLPGVGQHLQDHMTAGVEYKAVSETAGDLAATNSDFAKSPEFLSCINDAVAFSNITSLFGEAGAAGFKTAITNELANLTALVPSTNAEVIAGQKALYELNLAKFYDNTAQMEFLMSIITPGIVGIQAAMQHPYSVGRLYINSSNPFDEPVIDPNYFSHFADLTLLRQGIRLTRAIGAAYGPSLGEELSPGPAIQSDEQLDAWLLDRAGTQYHPTGSCAMLPRTLGGVVDSSLRVYGLANVRVVDSSVFPFEFAAHLASATYGVAEQAAVLIKTESFTVPASAAYDQSSSGGKSGASSLSAPSYALAFLAALAAALLSIS